MSFPLKCLSFISSKVYKKVTVIAAINLVNISAVGEMKPFLKSTHKIIRKTPELRIYYKLRIELRNVTASITIYLQQSGYS